MVINGRRITGVIILIIGAILSVVVVKTMLDEVPLWILGRRVTATIEETWWENLDMQNLDGYYFDVEYYIGYRFITDSGETIIGKTKVGRDEFEGFHEGAEVTVKYSPLNPSKNRLDDSRFVPFLLCSYIPYILISLFSLAAGREMLAS